MKFNCIECGLCCQNVGYVLNNKEVFTNQWLPLIKSFNLKAKKDGSCEMLKENNTCGCYSTRPAICDISITREIVAKNTPIELWNEQQQKTCHELQLKAGWSKEKITKEYTKFGFETLDFEKKIQEDR